MKRRPFLLALAAGSGCWPWPLTHAQAGADVAALLRTGGCVVMLRHAQTEAGIGDPPGFRIDQCSTQRNLSPEGRAQARRIGEWFKAPRPAAPGGSIKRRVPLPESRRSGLWPPYRAAGAGVHLQQRCRRGGSDAGAARASGRRATRTI